MLSNDGTVVKDETIPFPSNKPHLALLKANILFKKYFWISWVLYQLQQGGQKSILVVTDLFSKWVEAFSLVTTDSVTLAKVLVEEVVCRYGVLFVVFFCSVLTWVELIDLRYRMCI